METHDRTTAFLLEHCRRYPELQVSDLLKALHQSVFGPGHFITDPTGGLSLLQQELTALNPTAEAEPEPLDGPFCRFPLQYLTRHSLMPETLFSLFVLSAQAPQGTSTELEEKLSCLQTLAQQGRLPFSADLLSAEIDHWRQAGFPARRHSPAYRAAYAPAYRVIRRDFICWLPLLDAIDARKQGRRFLVAIEGGSASGKTTLAGLLAQLYPCTVLHMDDFFLRPEQRTPERLAQPGGNIDWERFEQEMLLPLSRNESLAYRRFDCATRQLLPPEQIVPTELVIVEGAYSMHPALEKYYDLSVFLQVSPQTQRQRIELRNTPVFAQQFFSTWIPLEQQYFLSTNTAERCDLLLENDL